MFILFARCPDYTGAPPLSKKPYLCSRFLKLTLFSITMNKVIFESTQNILKNRIIPMINGNAYSSEPSDFSPDGFDIFNVRQDVWTERMPLLEAAIGYYKPDLVIVDGIRDLINDINDGVLAQDIVERLMHLASDNHCCIVCVLHQNKATEDRNLRGWIGTELTHKAFEVYECEKDEYRIFSLAQKMTRKYDIINPLKYIVDAQGIPQLADGEQTSANGQQPAVTPLRSGFNRKYIAGWDENNRPILNLAMVFEEAMPDEGRLYPVWGVGEKGCRDGQHRVVLLLQQNQQNGYRPRDHHPDV